MLGWYIDFKKDQHAGFRFKKQHHFKCAEALNRQYNMGVTAVQVDRHFRHYKEKQKYIATALKKSGNTFDTTRCIVNLSESEKATLKDRPRPRRLLSKPIKFFTEMQKPFTDNSADGSLAMDAFTCMNDNAESDDSDGYNDLSNYVPLEEVPGDDSDTIPSPLGAPPCVPSPGHENSSSSSGIKRRRGMKSPAKRAVKPKSRMSRTTDEINTTLHELRKSLAEPPPPPPSPTSNSDFTLW